MKIREYLKITLQSLVLEIILSPIRGFGGFKVCLLVGFVTYFIFTVFLIKKAGKLFLLPIVIAVLFGSMIVQLPLRIVSFETSLGSFPDFLFHLLGAIFGLLYVKLPSPNKWLVVGAGILLSLFMVFGGYDLWLHKISYGTFSGRITYALPVKFEAFNQSKDLVTGADFSNKVVLLDFWNTSCGVCFRKFPKLQKFYEKYKDNPSIKVFAVDTPLDDDKEGDAFKAIKDEGHSFPVIITKDAFLAEKYGVKGYPNTFVIDQQGAIVFRGDIEGATKLVEELIKPS